MTGRLALALLGSLALAGCGSPPEPSRVTTLEVWSGWTGGEAKSFAALCDRYTREHPGIVVRNLAGVNDNTRVLRAITAGTPPDAFFVWNLADIGPMAHYGAIRTLDEVYRKAGFAPDAFVPGMRPLCEYKGKLVGLPLLMDTIGLMWSKEAFRAAGLDPERGPATLDELKRYAVRLTEFGPGGRIQRIGMPPPDPVLLCWVMGGDFFDEETGAPTANRPENVRAFQWYADLVEAMGGSAKVNEFSAGYGAYQGASNPFFTGHIAMQLTGEWMPVFIERYAPKMEYGVSPVPYDTAHPERKGTTQLIVNIVCIPTESKHPKEAWDFIRWLQRPDVQVDFAQALNNVPNVQAALRDPRLTTGSARKRAYGQFCRIAQHPNGKGFPNTPVSQLYLDELRNATDFVLLGRKTPREALDGVQAKVMREWRRLEGEGE